MNNENDILKILENKEPYKEKCQHYLLYELEGYKSEFVYTFNLSKYSDKGGSISWNETTKDQIFRYLVDEIKPGEVSSCLFDLSIIDNYYSIKDGAYELIVEDKEKFTIKVNLEKIA